MSKVVYKQVLQDINSKRGDLYPIEFYAPGDVVPLSVAVQNEMVCLWFECDPSQPKKINTVYCVGTGFGAIPDEGYSFIGTVVDGPYVWHLYRKV